MSNSSPHSLIRPLEGFRSLAILAVLLFHLDITFFKGGFLGVDLFFVISGFIITKNIVRQLEESRFSFKTFYLKRFRRLIPAQIVTVAVTIAVAYFVMPPGYFADLGKSAVYSLMSLANFNFWLESGYFDTASHTKPLLHMWSLAVEEQFYLFWPGALVLATAMSCRKWLLGVGFLASLALCWWVGNSHPSAAFFLFPFRIFQFFGGAALALVVYRLSSFVGSVTTIAGLGLFAAACMSLTGEYHPVIGGLLATISGVALIISMDSPVSKILFGNRVMVWIGQHSYSIYLVHWPLIVLAKHKWGYTLEPLEQVLLAAASFVLGYLLRISVEQPFRIIKGKSSVLSPWATLTTATALVVTLFLSSNVWGFNGYPGRLNSDVQRVLKRNDDNSLERREQVRLNKCHLVRQNKKSTFDPSCFLTGKNLKKPKVLVVGDSLAADTYMVAKFAMPNAAVSQATSAGCSAFFRSDLGNAYCARVNKIRMNAISEGEYDAIILASQWAYSDEAQKLEMTLEWLSQFDTHVIVFGPRVRFEEQVPIMLEAANSTQGFNTFATVRHDHDAVKSAELKAISNRLNATYIDIYKSQCDPECVVLNRGRFLYNDQHHLSVPGAAYLAEKMAPNLRQAIRTNFK